MNRRDAIRLLTGLTGGLLLSSAHGQTTAPTRSRLPLPLVQAPPESGGAPLPGASQPLAPGERPATPLPRIPLLQPIPEVLRVEYASNGHLEAAHAILLLPAADVPSALRLAQQAVSGSYAARPSLANVTASAYLAQGYDGFGGPAPVLTASVPKGQLAAFLALTADEARRAPRIWINQMLPAAPTPAPARERERVPIFVGSAAGLVRQQVQQLASQLSGGPRGGLYFHGPPAQPVAALSFDDAPHPIYAPLLLETLERARVKGTFFCIGRNARAYPYFVRDFAAAGHEIGNHTFHHVRLTDLPAAQVEQELRMCNDTLRGVTGQVPKYFRPPGGRYSPETLRIAEAQGLTTTFWTDDPGDFDNPGQRVLETRLTEKLRRGGIVLLHDNVLESIAILPRFLSYAATQRIRILTVGEMAGL